MVLNTPLPPVPLAYEAAGRRAGPRDGCWACSSRRFWKTDCILKSPATPTLLASRLREGIAALGYEFSSDSPSNQQFPILPNCVVQALEDLGYEFEVDHPVDPQHTCIRLVTSWATPSEAVEGFLQDLAACRAA